MKGKIKKKELSSREQVRARSHNDEIHDTYKLSVKLADPTVCPVCGAVYHRGRWTWDKLPTDAKKIVCPACRRIKDRYPGGIVHLSGPYLGAHHDELLNIVRNQEGIEKPEHPLLRIMEITEHDGSIEVTTTNSHLARRIGEALHKAHQGELRLQYADEDPVLRVEWRR